MNILLVKKYYHLIKNNDRTSYVYLFYRGKKQVEALKDLKLKEQTKAIKNKDDDNLSMPEKNF